MSVFRIRHNNFNCWFTWDEPNATWEHVKSTLIREIQQTGFDHFTGEESIVSTHISSNFQPKTITDKQEVKKVETKEKPGKPVKPRKIKNKNLNVENKKLPKLPEIVREKKDTKRKKVARRSKPISN
tara:strand:+ start:165 stop:545 length:381 start_codon:yes stop_codon:yes gene_type:complete